MGDLQAIRYGGQPVREVFREALQDVRDEQASPNFGGTRERVVGVAFAALGVSLCDRHAGARRQRPRQVEAGSGRAALVGLGGR